MNNLKTRLKKITLKYENYDKTDKLNLILDAYNKANAKVAIMCNHQKAVSKNFNSQLEKIKLRIKKLKKMIIKSTNKEKKEKYQMMLHQLKSKKH